MKPVFDLPVLQSMADSGAYGGARSLSANSALVVLCAGVWLSDLRNWQGAGFDLTADEIDEIDELVSVLQYETMTESGGGVSDYVKLEQYIHDTDVASITFDDFQSSDYVRYDLVLSGLYSDLTGQFEDLLQIVLNADEVAGRYNTMSNVWSAAGGWQPENIGNAVGFRPHAMCGCSNGGYKQVGAGTISFFDPNGAGDTQMRFNGGIESENADRSNVVNGVGRWERSYVVDEIEISPVAGTTFLVGGAGEPDNLIATLYGVK